MADISDYKTTDLDVVERGSGSNGEKEAPPAEVQAASGLEVSRSQLQCLETFQLTVD
jgi:hypothetical protein